MPTKRGCKDCDDGGSGKADYLAQHNLQTKESLLQLTHDRRKPLYQAVYALLPTGNRAITAYLHCIKDGVNIDPSAGSGTFLIEYMKFITENIKYRFRNELGTARAVIDKIESDWFYPDHRENKWAQTYIYASESNFNLGTATKVNMILHGDGSTNIFVKDGLLPFIKYEKETAPNIMHYSEVDELYHNKVSVKRWQTALRSIRLLTA